MLTVFPSEEKMLAARDRFHKIQYAYFIIPLLLQFADRKWTVHDIFVIVKWSINTHVRERLTSKNLYQDDRLRNMALSYSYIQMHEFLTLVGIEPIILHEVDRLYKASTC